MPKQKRYDFKRLQGSSSSKNDSKGEDGGTPSVNDQLSELRRADPTIAAMKKREIAAIVNQPSVPPSLRGILGVPETAPPRARQGSRLTRTRTPGPAPPSSWLSGDQSGTVATSSKRARKQKATVDRQRPEELFRFAKLCSLVDNIETTSLAHTCLKQLATNWHLLDEEDYESLAILPPAVRIKLISYLSFYGPAISHEACRALASDETVTMLDLAGLIGHDSLTLARLTRELKVSMSTRAVEPAVAESWDEEELEKLTISPMPTPFSKLTHLCLSHPPPTVLWQDLLNLTKHTPALTHLSLAYWPRPTLTPNLATTTVTSKFGADVVAGGSHFYSELDQDLEEPKALLRQLSHNLLRLQWLDIDGNPMWLLALAGSEDIRVNWRARGETTAEESWAIQNSVSGISNEFVTSWRNLTHVRCVRSYRPDAPWRVRRPGQSIWLPPSMSTHVPDCAALAEHLGVSDLAARQAARHREWWQAEQATVKAAHCINNFRKSHRCAPIVFDLGWNYK